MDLNMVHSGDLNADRAAALDLIMRVIETDGVQVGSVCCYDGAPEISKGQMNVPGGGHLLFLENWLYNFMLAQAARGMRAGSFYVHLKCLYLYTIHFCTTSEQQQQMADAFVEHVEHLNNQLGTNWTVYIEEGGSAPIES